MNTWSHPGLHDDTGMRADALRGAGVGSAAPSDLAHERLDRLFESQCDEMMELGHGNRTAVDSADGVLSYAALEAGANQLARYLRLQRVRGGDLVGVLLDHPADVCAAVLAISKCGAAAVPLDIRASCDHIGAIISESGVAAVITTGPLVSRLPGPDGGAAITIVTVDLAGEFISAQSPRRLTDGERRDAGGVAYVAYRIGADGRPIGIAVHHHHVCDFARVVVEGCGIGPYDRVVHRQLVYPHLEVEQTWIPWLAGATLVAPPSRLQGQALWQFLGRHRVTVLRADARTLAGLDERLLDLRLVVVTDPPCPQDPIARWQRPGRQVLRAHGHPGSTVVATGSAHRPKQMRSDLAMNGTAERATALGHLESADPTRAVRVGSDAGTLGAAVPAIRRADTDRSSPDEVGGRARRDHCGASADAAPSTTDDEVATALAGVLAGVLDRGQVRVDAHVFDDLGADSLTMAKFCARARAREDLPSPSIQEIYHHPTLRELAAALAPPEPATTAPPDVIAARLAAVLADVLGKDVPLDADVFDDLGADSLTMAKFCARVRKDPQLPTLAMADVYACPSAAGLADRVSGLVGADESEPTTTPPLAVDRRDPGRRVGTAGVALCGLVQIAGVLGWSYLFSLVLFLGYEWFVASPSLFELYRRSFVIGAVTFVFLCVFPVVVKWVAIGRWSPRTIRIWSLDYVRFWLVKTLTRLNPLVMFRGSPLYVLYLRALGARIGRAVAIFSQAVPVCTDLLTVGSGTVIRKDSLLSCYRARDGVIEIGPVSLGSNVFVGEATVLEVGTRVGDGGQLGHSSALPAGQAVPPGEHWHGSPARPCGVDYQPAGAARCGRTRKIVYSAVQLTLVLGVLMPVSFGGVALLLREVPQLASLLAPGPDAFRHWYFYAEILGLSLMLYVGFLLAAVLIQTTALRALGLLLRPDRTYPLYGVHYFVQRAIALLSNSIRLTMLLGDSSAIPHYLRGLGYRLTPLLQTGNNFGMLIKHESPSLAGVGTGTVVADDLSIVNAHFTNTSFFLSRAVIGAGSFLGNRITYPSGARVGDDCLLGTKVLVPIDGPLREGVGILGSPPFEIPRTVARDASLAPGPADVRQALRRKNRHNIGTMALHVLVRWLYFSGIALIIPAVALVDATLGAVEIVVAQVLIVVFTVGWFALVDRGVRRLLLRTPGGCSIYAPVFWGHERYWKVPAPVVVALFNGTPMKGMVWRLNGVNVGGRLFDDGASFIERPFTTIGDDCIFNERSVVQNHSQEDGSFKSDHTVLGSRVSIGVGAFVHYGVTIGDDVVIEADSFLMKGEEVTAGATWGGNPAEELSTTPGAVTP